MSEYEIVATSVIKHFYPELITKLPLEIKIFFGMCYKNDLIPSGNGGVIEKLGTRADKVSYFLDNVILPSPEEFLPTLLKVMEGCDNSGVQNLAKNIKTMLTGK